MKVDIVIIGGGIIGSSIAYFLARTGQAGSIVVLEPDPEYKLATTPKGAGGVRQLFSQPENIQMSQFSLQFYRDFANTMAHNGTFADIDFNQRGYLFVVSPSGAKQLEQNYKQQANLGVQAQLLDVPALNDRFPSINTADVALACFSPTDATISTTAALHHFRQQAENLGVSYVAARVTGLERQQGTMRSVTLADNRPPIQADVFVNAAGPWASRVSALVGMRLPIEPMCRVKHYWQAATPLEPLPLVKDESGMFFRPEGAGFVGGRPSWEIKSGFIFEQENHPLKSYFADYFEQTVRPLLSNRISAFSQAECTRSWTGHYAQNTWDGNMILGAWLGGAENFYVACGFSGHGVMHAPAVGLALSELILAGRYSTMDLSRMSYQRVVDNTPYKELGII